MDVRRQSTTVQPVSNQITGGVFFHTVIQGRDITVHLPPQITPALSGLPAASATFTGRDTEVTKLLELLAPGGDQQQAVLVASVAGLAGVGKTELVVQTAARALKRPGWFPGGVLFVDMFGYDTEQQLSPERALDGLLRALGIPSEHFPATLQDRSRLYRSVLATFAEQGRRILVVIDNASTAEQARPLLPTDGTTAALLTSRHTLDVDARLHDLHMLSPGASVELLSHALRHACGPADTRIKDAPEQAATIARLCAGLPLALRIAAALLADTPTRPLAALAQALEAAHTRLDRLRREDRAVRAAFDLSYERLTHDHTHLFRLLPLHAGPDLSTEATSHLTGTDQPRTEELLLDLARAHLIEPGHTWGRWRLHDLVRLYADQHGRTHADIDQRTAARSRLHDYYLTTTQAAETHLQTRPSTLSTRFSDRNHALNWLEDERLSLVATVTAAPPLGDPETSTALAFALVRFLELRRYSDDSITVTTSALAICRELGDRDGQGRALVDLSIALREVRRFSEAVDADTQAVTVFRELGHRGGEGLALTNLGIALGEMGRFGEAIDAHTQALTIFRELGDRDGEGAALNSLGTVLKDVGRFGEAIDAHTQAVTVFRELGERAGEGAALNNLGLALRKAGRFGEAIDAHTQDLVICRELGNRYSEGVTLSNLGLTLRDVGRNREAIDAQTQARLLFRELGDHDGEESALNNLGLALRKVGRFGEAIDAHTEGLAICRELGDRYGESRALNNLGLVLDDVGRFGEAIDAHTEGLAICRELGDRYSERTALNNLGLVLQNVGRLREAIDAHTEDLAICRELGDRQDERQALKNLSLALLKAGKFRAAIHARAQANGLHREGQGQSGPSEGPPHESQRWWRRRD